MRGYEFDSIQRFPPPKMQKQAHRCRGENHACPGQEKVHIQTWPSMRQEQRFPERGAVTQINQKNKQNVRQPSNLLE